MEKKKKKKLMIILIIELETGNGEEGEPRKMGEGIVNTENWRVGKKRGPLKGRWGLVML